MRRGGAPARPASTQQILELRDQGLTWPDIAEQVDLTVPVPGAVTGRPGRLSPPRLGRWQRVLAEALDRPTTCSPRSNVNRFRQRATRALDKGGVRAGTRYGTGSGDASRGQSLAGLLLNE
jgi:hypothetical protein